MRLEVCISFIGIILLVAGLAMILSAVIGLIYHDGSADVLLISGLLTACIGAFPWVFVPLSKNVTLREAVFIVFGAWTTISIIGALPFYLYGSPFNAINAIFESTSGFTTTGASILADIEALPHGLLFWRAMTHFIGGSGIVVFAIAVLPGLHRISNELFSQEYSGIAVGRQFGRSGTLSQIIVTVFAGLILLETIVLMICKLSWFDALTISFATVATGGFAPYNSSIASLNSLTVEIIMMVFMIISGMNFAFLYGLFFGRGRKNIGWETVKYYLLLLSTATLIASAVSYQNIYPTLGESIRYASFQVISVGTSTGFASADSSVWPYTAHFVILLMTLICASAGSTSGGIKIDRVIIFFKLVRQYIRSVIHPRMIRTVRLNGRTIELEAAKDAMIFIILYLTIAGFATFLLAITGTGLREAFSGTAACISNVGPGLGKIGSLGNYNGISGFGKLLLCSVMLIGRLELLVFILPFTRSFWKA